MKNIHILPTDKPSRLAYDFYEKFYLLSEDTQFFEFQNLVQNRELYITSDEEIIGGKEWFLDLRDNFLFQNQVNEPMSKVLFPNCKKIILTTDQDLINDGVQSIDDEFLEWFVKNPSCEEVKVETNRIVLNDVNYNFDIVEYKYKIIIPKEEPKQDYNNVHFSHCYQGEYEDSCKYGEDDCPAKPKQETKQVWQSLDESINGNLSITSNGYWKDVPKEQQKLSQDEFKNVFFGQTKTNEAIGYNTIAVGHNLKEELEPLEVPMPVYNEDDLTYEEDLVKKIAVVLSVGNEAQAVRLIEKYVQYRLEPFEELVNNWHQRQIHYQDVAEYNVDNQHTNRKFTYKAMATRDCWKELLTLINK